MAQIPATVDPSDTLAVLKAAEVWLSDQARWTVRVLWRRSDGSALAVDAGEACRELIPECAQTCASGALALVAGGEWPGAAVKAVGARLPAGIVEINDGPDGYVRIMAALRQAIEAEEARP